MKRAKVGDVYSFKTSNGYKLFQWAYRIPKWGDYIRVFPGLYDEIPNNLEDIVNGSHNYIIGFYASRAYRVGLTTMLGNYPVPEQYPFPTMALSLSPISIRVAQSFCPQRGKDYPVTSVDELPEEYQGVRLLNGCVTPAWLFYLLEIDWDLTNVSLFYPGENNPIVEKYLRLTEEALAQGRGKKTSRKTERT